MDIIGAWRRAGHIGRVGGHGRWTRPWGMLAKQRNPSRIQTQGVPNSSPEAVPYSIFETPKQKAKRAYSRRMAVQHLRTRKTQQNGQKHGYYRRVADSWTYRRV